MKCLFCKGGITAPGTSTSVHERGQMVIVVKDVPTHICTTCGERYYDDEIVQKVVELVDEVEKKGTQVEVVRYAA